ncbi:hypothetical protein UMN179_02512 [Gallibacterium anatis UMN179]|uniref:Uncharacterized protein n=1 Tax=Gallibacterium anatis (strain UMN179) TaxID=1005058 RepID=F4HA32_GALAU|nr:hypothetical protein [Gallibacterium anatis]AEC18519.1 hypothetical protein UMN179_02512 [Gallibacterium anatis UMN179]
MKILISLAVKEDGYDEFLAGKVKKAISNADSCNVVSFDDWLADINQFSDKLIIELEQKSHYKTSRNLLFSFLFQ